MGKKLGTAVPGARIQRVHKSYIVAKKRWTIEGNQLFIGHTNTIGGL